MAATIKIDKGAKITVSGTLNEGGSGVQFKSNGNLNCYEIVEVPVFTSVDPYSPAACENYSYNNTDVYWGNEHIVEKESKKVYWKTKDSILCLVIKDSNGKFHVSYQKVLTENSLEPLKIYQVQDSNIPFIYIEESSKKIYCTSFTERISAWGKP